MLRLVPHQRACDTQELLLSYNIGIDHDARQRDTIRRSAASVGLQLPQAPQDRVSQHFGLGSEDSGERLEHAKQAYDDSSGRGASRQ